MYSFPIQETEHVLKKDHASLTIENSVFAGALYLTNERLVFVGYILDISNKFMEEVPYQHIREMNRGKTFCVIPNVLTVDTIRGRRLRIVVAKRDEWFCEIEKLIEATA